MKKKIVINLLLVSMGQTVWSADPNSPGVSQETATERKAKPGFWTDYRKRIAYISGGVGLGVLGGLVWYSSFDIAANMQRPLSNLILKKVTKNHELSPEQFSSWMSGIIGVARVFSIGIFIGSGYLLKKGIEKNNFGAKLDQVLGS